jgi:hypothetical protein
MTVEHPRTGVAYFGNRFPGHARADLRRIAPVCDYIVHTVSETDFYFHKRALEQIVGDSRRLGLEVWVDPWGLGGVFGGESFSKFLLDHPGAWQVLSDGRRAPAACLRRREFRDFVREWLDVVRSLGAQTVFWDEPHVHFHWDLEWEGIYGCVCGLCRETFRGAHGRDLPPRLDEDAKELSVGKPWRGSSRRWCARPAIGGSKARSVSTRSTATPSTTACGSVWRGWRG